MIRIVLLVVPRGKLLPISHLLGKDRGLEALPVRALCGFPESARGEMFDDELLVLARLITFHASSP